MTGIIIAILFAGIIVLLLTSSLSVTLNITDKICFKVSLLGICVFDINSVKDKKTSAKKKSRSDKKGLTSLLKEYADNKDKKELVFDMFSLFKKLCIKFSKLLKHVRIKKLEVNLKIASDDAAKTAILYGNACSIVYSLVALLKSACGFDHKKIAVSADFSSDKIDLTMLSNIRIRVIYIVYFAISVAYTIIKMKLGEIKNGRPQH